MTDKDKRKKGLLIGQRGQLIEPRKNFTLRLSDEERKRAEYDAKANNMKLSDYVRYLILLLHGGRTTISEKVLCKDVSLATGREKEVYL